MSGTASEPMLEVHDIHYSYGSHQVLNGVTFNVDPGQIVGVIGENGSGKSTLLKIIAGLLSADRGEVRAFSAIGYCPQDLLVYDGLTVREHLRLFETAYGLDDRGSARIDDILRRFRFERFVDDRVTDLSGGTQQKLNLSLAVLHSPALLILDEPYSGFDMETYLRFWEFARDEKSAGRSLLIVSHIVYDCRDFDTIYALRGGKLACV